MKKFCCKKKTNYRISQDYGSITRLECIEKWKLTGHKKTEEDLCRFPNYKKKTDIEELIKPSI